MNKNQLNKNLFPFSAGAQNPDHDFWSFFSECETKTFQPGETILLQEELFKGIYCIREGLVKISRVNNNGEEHVLWFAEPEEMPGLSTLLDEEKRYGFSATAVNAVKAYFISPDAFSRMMKEHEFLKQELIRLLCQRIDQNEKWFVGTIQKSSRARLAEIILFFAEKAKRPGGQKIAYSVADLASITGITQTYLLKLLSEFSQEKLIKRSRQKFAVLDKLRLARVASGKG